MIGYSQYVQENAAEIVRQRINLFLASYFLIYPSLLNFMTAKDLSSRIKTSLRKALFYKFILNLKENNAYEEYLVSSIFTEQINYDFITTEDSKIVNDAKTSLDSAFEKYTNEYLDNTSISTINTNEPILGFPTDDPIADAGLLGLIYRKYLSRDVLAEFHVDNIEGIPVIQIASSLDNTLKDLINFSEE